MHRAWCVALLLAAAAAAQDDWDAQLQQRMLDGKDLIELRFRRDEQGLLWVASCEGGARPFERLFPEDWQLRDTGSTGLWGLVALCSGDLLAMTDSERHLRRAGIDTDPIELRQFLVKPAAGGDDVRARVDLLDRLVAIDLLRRSHQRGAIAELKALAARKDTPALLRAGAERALGELTGAPLPRRRLDPASLPLPLIADGYLVVDHARLPDLNRLTEIARRFGIRSSYRVMQALRAPTPDDLYMGQWFADMAGELPFEFVRRFGNLRLDHTTIAVTVTAPGTGRDPPFAWCAATVGEFDFDRLAAGIGRMVPSGPDALIERRDGSLRIEAPFGEVTLTGDTLTTHGRSMKGRPRPDLAAELLAPGPAIRVVLPPTSKAWVALAFLRLPPAGGAKLEATFGDEFQLQLTIQTRDEDGAEAWVARGKELLAQVFDEMKAKLDPRLEEHKELQAIVAALAGVRIRAAGSSVHALLASRQLGWPTLTTLLDIDTIR